jgi:hypothetical protein
MNKLWNKMLRIPKDKLWHFVLLNQVTAVLLKVSLPVVWVLVITIGLSVGKEIYDRHKGQYVDFGDLFADFMGIGLAFLT